MAPDVATGNAGRPIGLMIADRLLAPLRAQPARALRIRGNETAPAVRRCWAKRLRRSSSSIHLTGTSRFGLAAVSGRVPPASS